jgi:Rieske Fe-S protein
MSSEERIIESPPLNPDAGTSERRTVLKGGAALVVAVAFPGACGSMPLPTEPADGGAAGNTGEGGGSGGGNAGSTGVAGQAPPPNCSFAAAAGLNASAVAVGSLIVVGGDLVIGRDAGGLYAMSALCTHQGCPVTVVGSASQDTLYCRCHGSVFDGNGAVVRGPARSALPHYQLDVSSDGALTVCQGSPVASGDRSAG